MKYLESIEFEGTTYKLGPLTVIVGPNGSGKSSLLYAIKKASAYSWSFLYDSQLRAFQHKTYLEAVDLGTIAGLLEHTPNIGQIYTMAAQEVNPNYQKVTMYEEFLLHTKDGKAIQDLTLSTGTRNFLALSAFLANAPNILLLDCPEVGLHPDLLPTLSDMIHDAIEKGSQVILVTHSDLLLSCLGKHLDILIAMGENSDIYTRAEYQATLDRKEMSLGDLWLRGDLGGCRW